MFSSTLAVVLTIAAVIIIVFLSAVAAFLHWQLHLRKKRDDQLRLEQEQRIEKQRDKAINSLRIIAKSYLSEQVELGEASIRIANIMRSLELSEFERAPYKVFETIHAELEHIPILQAWKDLTKKERKQHLTKIASVESRFAAEAKPAAEKMAQFKLVTGTFYSA